MSDEFSALNNEELEKALEALPHDNLSVQEYKLGFGSIQNSQILARSIQAGQFLTGFAGRGK